MRQSTTARACLKRTGLLRSRGLKREALEPLVTEAIANCGGAARIADVCKFVWENYEKDIRASGKYFYVWQYELRWASDSLVKQGRLKKGDPRGIWRNI